MTIQERLLLAFASECFLCWDDGTLRHPDDGDVHREVDQHNRQPPDARDINQIVSWLEGTLDDNAKATSGRVPLRRLNRREYANAVRDLLGLDIDA